MNYPIGLQTFREIREQGYVYVDKTSYIPLLLKNGKYKFLSRPRRFGKSLLVSMLESFFKGERDLFKGLSIDKLYPEPWESHPVVHLDFSGEDYSSVEILERKINTFLKDFEVSLSITPSQATFSERLRNIVRSLNKNTKSQVVVLIDEYDNPITSAIGNHGLQERYREILYGFYSSLKSLDSYIHFCLLTGVTKYGHLPVFSGLNNLMDISLQNEFAGIGGITEEELHEDLKEGVKELSSEEGISLNETFNILKNRYDGYHFSKSLLDVYNPLSLMSALARREIADYWNLTGSPSLLLKILQESPLNIKELNHARASAEMLENISAFNINPIALFYQTGYLTIKDYDRETRLFTLGYPNKEVESGLMNNLLSIYGKVSDSTMLISDLKRSLDKGEVEHFISLLKSFFAEIPFDLRKNVGKYENYYHTIFYVLLRLLGIETHAEYHTSEGSIDVMIKTSLFIYIIEIKINGSASDAIEQINSRSYDAPFATDTRTKIKLGIGFSDKTHNIDSYLIETQG